MKKNMLYLAISFCFQQTVFCQNIPGTQTSCTTASQGTAGNFVISYTIGEMALVQSWKNNGLLITQGTLQPPGFIADTAYECFNQAEVKVYPNPNPGTFALQVSLFKKGKIRTVLFDASGRQLQADDFEYNSFLTRQYNISRLASGIYYLQLFFTETGGQGSKKCVYTIEKIN